MVHIYHFLKDLVSVDDIRPILATTFRLPELRKPKILDKIEGVIEVHTEDISDEDLLLLQGKCEENRFQNETKTK